MRRLPNLAVKASLWYQSWRALTTRLSTAQLVARPICPVQSSPALLTDCGDQSSGLETPDEVSDRDDIATQRSFSHSDLSRTSPSTKSLYIGWCDVAVICGHITISMLWGNTAYCHYTLSQKFHYFVSLLFRHTWIDFYRASYASAVLGVLILSVRLSVCLSVYHTRALWLIQRTDRRYFYTARKGNHCSFLMPNISAKFQRGHPQRGRQRELG